MTDAKNRERLQNLALLFLSMAHRTDGYLSDVELSSITEKLHAHESALEWARVQDIVMESLGAYTRADDVEQLGATASAALHRLLTLDQKRRVLDDLRHIARADGVVLDGERGLLTRLALRWGLDTRRDAPVPPRDAPPDEGWEPVHCLAYLYLHLAHATDNELSPQEMQVMLNKLHEWQPQHDEAHIQEVMNTAMNCYARGPDEALLERAIASVRDNLPHVQRMAALNDLVKIANADGVFLDVEEDMINHLVAAWDVDPSASYRARGRKR